MAERIKEIVERQLEHSSRLLWRNSRKLCNKLWQFRLTLEGQAGQLVIALEVPVASLLSDLCVFAGLSEEQHARVLGQEDVAYTPPLYANTQETATHQRQGNQ